MKILIELDEVKKIVEQTVKSRHRLAIKANSATIVSHIEGRFDESEKVMDGISFEIEEG
jgi:hypothetical protein